MHRQLPTVGLLVLCGCLVQQAVALPASGVGSRVTPELNKVIVDPTITGLDLAAENTKVPRQLLAEVEHDHMSTPYARASKSKVIFDKGLETVTLFRGDSLVSTLAPVKGYSPSTAVSSHHKTSEVKSGSKTTSYKHSHTTGVGFGSKTTAHGHSEITPSRSGAQYTSVPSHSTVQVNSHSKNTPSGHEHTHTAGYSSSAQYTSLPHHDTTGVESASKTTGVNSGAPYGAVSHHSMTEVEAESKTMSSEHARFTGLISGAPDGHHRPALAHDKAHGCAPVHSWMPKFMHGWACREHDRLPVLKENEGSHPKVAPFWAYE